MVRTEVPQQSRLMVLQTKSLIKSQTNSAAQQSVTPAAATTMAPFTISRRVERNGCG